MMGDKGAGASAIAKATRTAVTIRGRDLCSELMGKVDFTTFFFLHLTGEMPTENQKFFLDTVLVALAEHGLTPSAQAARMTLQAGPDAIQGAVAAGILGCGSVILGSAEVAGQFYADGVARVAAGEDMRAVAHEMVSDLKTNRKTLPGFGHPVHKPVDPRAERLLELADERGASGPHVAFLRAVNEVVEEVYGRKLVLNLNGPLPAVMLDLGFPLKALKGIAILCRTAGLVGHCLEELERPIGFRLAHLGDQGTAYDGTWPNGVMPD
ncbi:MAG: citryl-CoA lyase [Pseudomonadota bacterium]|nr:citryl-CoA lyase [Pseudomonadota bacterium]